MEKVMIEVFSFSFHAFFFVKRICQNLNWFHASNDCDFLRRNSKKLIKPMYLSANIRYSNLNNFLKESHYIHFYLSCIVSTKIWSHFDPLVVLVFFYKNLKKSLTEFRHEWAFHRNTFHTCSLYQHIFQHRTQARKNNFPCPEQIYIVFLLRDASGNFVHSHYTCLLYTSPSPRD